MSLLQWSNKIWRPLNNRTDQKAFVTSVLICLSEKIEWNGEVHHFEEIVVLNAAILFEFFIRTISRSKSCNSAKCIAWVWSLKHQPKCKQPQIWNRSLDFVHFHTDATIVLVVFTCVEGCMLIKYIFSFILGLDHEKWSKIAQKLVLAVIKLIDQLPVLSYASKKLMYQLVF